MMTKHTRDKWAERIREWKESGLSAEDFTADKDYEPSSLRWAVSQLPEGAKPATRSVAKVPRRARSAAKASRARAPRFLPLRVAEAAGEPDVVVEVGGARIGVSRGADLALVGDARAGALVAHDARGSRRDSSHIVATGLRQRTRDLDPDAARSIPLHNVKRIHRLIS